MFIHVNHEVNKIFIDSTLLDLQTTIKFYYFTMELVMKIIIKSSLIALIFTMSQFTLAGTFIDTASVVSVDKVYKQVRVEEPYKECYIKETVQNSGDGSCLLYTSDAADE